MLSTLPMRPSFYDPEPQVPLLNAKTQRISLICNSRAQHKFYMWNLIAAAWKWPRDGVGAGSVHCSLRYFVAIICTSLCLQATNLILFKVPMRRSALHLHMPLQTQDPESQPKPNPAWMADTVLLTFLDPFL